MMNANRIFAGVSKFGRLSIASDKRRSKVKQIRDVTRKKCGNCSYWMTSYCKPEKLRGEFKRCNSFACRDFSLKITSIHLCIQFNYELDQIDETINRVARS